MAATTPTDNPTPHSLERKRRCIPPTRTPCLTPQKHLRPALLLFCLILMILVSGCRQKTSSCALHIAAASSLIVALQPIVREFTLRHKCRIWLDVGSSGMLRRKIERGAPLDLYLSASHYQMQRLQQNKQLTLGPAQTFASNRLVFATQKQAMVAPKQKQKGLRQMAQVKKQTTTQKAEEFKTFWKNWTRSNKRVAIGDPDHVPAGRYAQQAFQKVGLWKMMKARILRTKDVRSALKTVQEGHLSGAIIFASDAETAKEKVVVRFLFPKETHSPILYQGVVLSHTSRPKLAKLWLTHLRSPQSQRVFHRFHFLPPPGLSR